MAWARAIFLIAVLSLAACAGGGRTATLVPTAAATAAPAAVQRVPTTFTFTQSGATVPAGHRRAAYIGAGTQSVAITLVSVNGSPVSGAQNASNANVTLTGCPCTVAGPSVPAGADVFTVATYDGTFASGVQSGHLIATGTTAPITIAANGVNTISLTLNGVPATFTIANVPTAAAGTPLAVPAALTIVALDADGNTILGAYAQPVTLADSDASGATTLTTAGSDSPAAGQLLSSSDTVTLAYTGLAIAPATISAAATGAQTGSAVFAPVLQPIETSTTTVGINQVQNTAPVTASEVGWTNAPYNRTLTATTPACGTLASASPASGTSFVVTSGTSLVAGSCSLVLGDFTGGQTATVAVNYAVHGEITYLLTGAQQSFTVPAGITSLTVTAAGAQGGYDADPYGPTEGAGGTEYATVPVTPGETLAVFVGGSGQTGAGGYNGGGGAEGLGALDGGGGGASDVREGGTALANRIIVGGGGGGAGASAPLGCQVQFGGPGGIAAGAGQAVSGGLPNATAGGPGTSSAGGAGGVYSAFGTGGNSGTLGAGGAGGSDSSTYRIGGGGGGGGYYGGGGGGSGDMYEDCGGGGGGGSSYVEPSATGVVSNTGTWTSDGTVAITW